MRLEKDTIEAFGYMLSIGILAFPKRQCSYLYQPQTSLSNPSILIFLPSSSNYVNGVPQLCVARYQAFQQARQRSSCSVGNGRSLVLQESGEPIVRYQSVRGRLSCPPRRSEYGIVEAGKRLLGMWKFPRSWYIDGRWHCELGILLVIHYFSSSRLARLHPQS